MPQGSQGTAGLAAGDPEPEGPGQGRRRRSETGQDTERQAGAPRGTPAQGTPVVGAPGRGHPGRGTPAQDTPVRGVPQAQARGGHPEQRESGGGWGSEQRYGDRPGAARGPAVAPRQKRQPTAPSPLIPGPRREFIDAFDSDAFDAPSSELSSGSSDSSSGSSPGGARTLSRESAPAAPSAPSPAVDDREGEDREGERAGGRVGDGIDGGPDADPAAEQPAKGGKGRAFTGIAAAAVTTVLAVVVAGQVADGGGDGDKSGARAAGGVDRGVGSDDASRSVGGEGPKQREAPVKPATYEQLMAEQFPLDPKLKASGDFAAVPGLAKAPGKGQKFRYRVDVEKGLGLDGTLFADAVQKTLNDDRSWAHNGAMTFERTTSGEADFVITLASPGTTAFWCEKSGLDTTVDNVSCDSASTERVMINAYRWAQGAETFGAKAMFPYRQMLINHEVGHRLGYNHVSCQTPGALAPVMQQQTKSLDIGGIKCEPNPWVFPGS
ncbi:DUF3152 domain-containing protein [Streptomyces sp. NPDC088116]|uniref:DUF3152 domain-containing protein n=1 Tax=Streptomyces sp. NPDC088116 TaxID=3365825 RepID=UPI0037F2491B